MPITPGELHFSEGGIPASQEYGDIYHSSDGGLLQARAVFLQGCGLPVSCQDKNRFVILETGFGLGLNFLATWEVFRQHPGQCKTLHFISVEKHPLSIDSLLQCHAAWPELAELAQQLRHQWPVLVAGYHRLSFDNGRVQLTLIFDDAETALKQLDASVDAIYLDGFSPAKNPALWSPTIMQQLARLAAPNARLATWCVAGAVRQSLQQAGFLVERKPGFGHKKERLEARYQNTSPLTPRPSPISQSATLIGAGIAGVSLAHALCQRGWQVNLIERHSAPAMGASGNPAGVVRPQLTLDESFNGRLSRQAFLHTVKQVSTLTSSPFPLHGFSGVLHLARNDEQAKHMPAMLAAHNYQENFARWVNQDEAGELAGCPVAAPGLYFPQGGWLSGGRTCKAMLSDCGTSLTRHFTTEATRIEQTAAGWRVWEGERLISESAALVLTSAYEAAQFAGLPLTPVRGQITKLPDGSLPGLKIPVTREGYVLPTLNGIGNIGASFAFDDDPAPRASEQHENLSRLNRLLTKPPTFDADRLEARVSFRAATPDRLPLVGGIADDVQTPQPESALEQLPRKNGLFVLSGLGARGLVWGSFLAQALAARMDGEHWMLPRDLWQAIDPARFWLRNVRKKTKTA